MVNDSTYKAAKVADVIQTAAKLLVLLIIIPAAVLLAVFFITEPFISEIAVRQTFSLAFALCLAGAIGTKTGRNLFGYVLVLSGAVLGAYSLSIFWDQSFMTMGCVHVTIIIALVLALDASSKKLLEEQRATVVIWTLILLAIVTGPLIGALYMIQLGSSPQLTLLIALLASVPYLIGLHIYQKRPILAIVETVVFSAAMSQGFAPILYSGMLVVDLFVEISAHLIVFGISLLLSSQMLKYVQTSIPRRTIAGTRYISERQRIEALMGLDEYTDDETVSETPMQTLPRSPWIIDPNTAHALSSLGLILVACGVPTQLVSLAALSSFVESSWVPLLFFPLAAIVSFLVMIPAMVFLRLARYMTRGREEQTVKLLGLLTVLAGTTSSFMWTQFSFWPIEQSLALAGAVIVTGVTGIFREVRRIWRSLWFKIVHRFRMVKHWIRNHPVQTGVAIDLLLTAAVLSLVVPLMSGLPYYELALIPLSITIASGFGMIGIGALKRMRSRMKFAAVTWILFLSANAVLTHWILTALLDTGPIQRVTIPMIWMLGSAALQKIEVSRKVSGLFYLPGVVGAVWYLHLVEPLYLPTEYLLPATAIIILPVGVLREEYTRGLTRAKDAMAAALIRIGVAVYHAMIAFGEFLIRFILVSYASLAVFFIAYGSYAYLYSGLRLELTYILVIAAFLFFLSYSPVVKYRGMEHRTLVTFVIAGLALFTGALAYHLALTFVPQIHSLFLAVTTATAILAALREELPDTLHPFIPLVLWGATLLSGSSLVYWWLSRIYEQDLAYAWTGVIVALYMLMSSRSERLKVSASIGYAISIVAACVLFWSAFGLPLTYLVAGIALTLIPVASSYYVRALRHVGRLAQKIGEALLVLVLTYAVIAAAIVGLFASLVILTNTSWFFNTMIQPDLARVLFTVLVTLLCASAAVLKVQQINVSIRTAMLVSLSTVTSLFVVLLLQPMEPMVSILVASTILCLVITPLSSLIPEIRDSRHPLVLGLILLMVLSLQLVTFDLVLKALVAISWTAAVLGLVVEKKNFLKVLYPVATSGVLGLVSLHVLLPFADLLTAAMFFVMLESLLLCIPEDIYHPISWALFSISTGYFVYLLVSLFSNGALLLAAGTVTELLGRTPRVSGQKARVNILFAALRGTWIGLLVALQCTPLLGLVIATELALLASLVTLRISMSSPSKKLYVILQNLVGLASSAVVYSLCLLFTNSIVALHLALLPAFAIAAVHSQSESFQSVHQGIVISLIVFYSMTLWTLLYPIAEVIPLSITSALASISLLRWFTSDYSNRRSLTPISAVILLLEVAWIWHAYFIFKFSAAAISTGAALLLLSSLLIPATDSMKWARFEFVWEAVSGLNAVILGAYLSGWTLFQFGFPSQPLLTLGWILSLYGVFLTPAIFYGESRNSNLDRIAHISWSPSILGWVLVAWEYTIAFSDVHLRLGVSAVAFSCAITPFLLIHPRRNERYPLMADVFFASSLAYVSWFLGGAFNNEVVRMVTTLIVWYFVALPASAPATLWALSRAKEFAVKHKTGLVFFTPPITGLFVFATLFNLLRGLLLDTHQKLLLPTTCASFALGFLYYSGARVVEDRYETSALGLSLVGITTTAFTGPALVLFPGSGTEFAAALFALSTSMATALLVMSALSRAFHFGRVIHPSHILGGVSSGIAMFIGLSALVGIPLIESLLMAMLVTLLIEVPFITEQIRALMKLLANLGAIMLDALKRLNAFLRYLFDRFGYVLWLLFSGLVTMVIGTLSYPFFSELVGMKPGTPLYSLPSYSIPLGLFGLLLISIAAIRRGVQSSFGMSSVGILVSGVTATAAAFLIDRGLVIPAISATLAMGFMSLTVLANHLEKDESVLRRLFFTVPISVAVFIASLFYNSAMSTNLMSISIGLSLIVCFSLFIASTRVGLTDESMLKSLQVGIAGTSALITYAAASLAFLPLPCIYLSAFVMSWLLLPVAKSKHLHLFNAPLFFALTGFGFTFVFGELIQGLLLATASLLLFVSLYIRDHESEKPRLVFVRLLALLALITCLVGFAVLTFIPVMV